MTVADPERGVRGPDHSSRFIFKLEENLLEVNLILISYHTILPSVRLEAELVT